MDTNELVKLIVHKAQMARHYMDEIEKGHITYKTKRETEKMWGIELGKWKMCRTILRNMGYRLDITDSGEYVAVER